METILITGASGLIGKRITDMLLAKGYRVIHLSRKPKVGQKVKVFAWNIAKQSIDKTALQQADYIIHLAGAGIADKRWTTKRKKEIVDSRVESANLLYKSLQQTSHHIKAIISASAIGYYGNNGDTLLDENVLPANDFLGATCLLWEQAIQQFTSLNIREVRLRIGIVLAKKGGALPELVTPVKFCIAPLFGAGKPYYSWIHLDDLCTQFIFSMEHENIKGAYNAVAPNPVRFKVLMNAVRKNVNRFSIPLPVPGFVLQIMLGEMGNTLSYSVNASSQKIKQQGFHFQYERVEEAIEKLFRK